MLFRSAEDGREFYAISTEFDPESAGRWVRTHVLPKLPSPSSQLWRSRRQIREGLEEFFDIDGDEPIELWAWVAAYDHVALCQLWGPMTSLPPQIPRFTRELRQLWESYGTPRMPPRPQATPPFGPSSATGCRWSCSTAGSTATGTSTSPDCAPIWRAGELAHEFGQLPARGLPWK